MAFDDKVVAAALGSKYGEGGVKAGYDFLEKIVQVPLRLPAASGTSLRRFFLREVDRLLNEAQITISEEEAHSFVHGFDRGFGRALTTPRMARRYGNALAFGIPLLAGEVATVDLLLIEAMRVFFPTLYDFVKTNSKTVLHPGIEDYNKQETIDLVTSAIDRVEVTYRTDARRLLFAVFPRLESVFGNMTYSSESDVAWAREKRVCSEEYFQRYFSYALAKGDVSDREIAMICSAAEQKNAEAVAKQLKRLLTAETAESVLTKLSHRVDELCGDAAALLAKEFARCGSLFSRIGGFASLSPSTRAGGLVAALVERSPKGDQRLAIATETLHEAEPIGFAAECLSWFRAGRDKPESERAFTEADANKLCKTLADRINSSADCALIKDNENLLLLMYVWSNFGYPNAPRELLTKCLESDATLVVRYLRSAVGMAYPIDGSRPHPGDFDKDSHSAVLRYVDGPTIYAALKKLFGDRLNQVPPAIRNNDVSDDERIAQQFAALHKSSTRAQG